MKNVVIALLAVIPLIVTLGIQNAYAVPDCVGVGTEDLLAKEMYVGTSTAKLAKVDTTDGTTCEVGPLDFFGTPVQCTDLALDVTDTDIYGNPKLYCVTFTDLYEIDRGTGAATFIGNLLDVTSPPDLLVTDMNGMEIDFGGIAYGISDSGKLYRIDLAFGDLLLLKDFAQQSSGDLAWDSVTADLFWTTNTCPACALGVDGLYRIDLQAVPPTSTFLGDISGQTDVFAADFVDGSANIFYVNFGGTLIESKTNTDIVDTVVTSPKVLAFGGTANQALVGGVIQAINYVQLLINGLESASIWLTSGVIGGGIALVALFRNKI